VVVGQLAVLGLLACPTAASASLLSPAAEDAASYWYTAWMVAGRPELK